ncbi:hypothetical protein GXP67_13480 [Rhodocytophaga rosea]|uniref:Uncharacterized protein n=1 Tax=Rhodocytophaga rosea TaxID=2704465 RepID=A0A6C0GHZ2_9BACT|nr:hypothetical protein [Rhodocytophaga rosea]QHT67567.1 hypothetical protein GXP67_13480 [Rhodocytophaga rosea]
MPYFYPVPPEEIDYFYKDLMNWLDWYEDNKCKITINKADSIIFAYGLNHLGDTLSWPTDVSSQEEISERYFPSKE